MLYYYDCVRCKLKVDQIGNSVKLQELLHVAMIVR